MEEGKKIMIENGRKPHLDVALVLGVEMLSSRRRA
jgi:hypothetical protein